MKYTEGAQHIGDLFREKNIVLKRGDVLSQRGFTQVPNHVLRSDKITPAAKLVYAMLLSYAWQNDFCFPGQERLATDIGISVRSVVSYIRELEKAQFLISGVSEAEPRAGGVLDPVGHPCGGQSRVAASVA